MSKAKDRPFVEMDGARGEGGGQILRTSLALSMITGKPLHMTRIRANRAKPGLRHQHLACVEAAAALCAAKLEGAKVGSSEITFTPSESSDTWKTELEIDIGTAGSTSLVLQTILVPALASGRGLVARVIGGTHNPMAPPFDFLDRVFVPVLRMMGAKLALSIERYGFATGDLGAAQQQNWHDDVTPHRGHVTARIEPGPMRLLPISLVDGGPLTQRHATALIVRLPTHVARRELRAIQGALGFAPTELEVREYGSGGGRGNAVMIEFERGGVRELVTEFGMKGVRAEVVAQRAIQQAQQYLAHEAPVGEHLADQLLLPLALAGAGRFRCAPLSLHATTNIETIQQFIPLAIEVSEPAEDGTVIVRVGDG